LGFLCRDGPNQRRDGRTLDFPQEILAPEPEAIRFTSSVLEVGEISSSGCLLGAGAILGDGQGSADAEEASHDAAQPTVCHVRPPAGDGAGTRKRPLRESDPPLIECVRSGCIPVLPRNASRKGCRCRYWRVRRALECGGLRRFGFSFFRGKKSQRQSGGDRRTPKPNPGTAYPHANTKSGPLPNSPRVRPSP